MEFYDLEGFTFTFMFILILPYIFTLLYILNVL